MWALIVLGVLVLVASLFANRRQDDENRDSRVSCPTDGGTTAEPVYLPRTLDMQMRDAEDVGALFSSMFERNFEYSR